MGARATLNSPFVLIDYSAAGITGITASMLNQQNTFAATPMAWVIFMVAAAEVMRWPTESIFDAETRSLFCVLRLLTSSLARMATAFEFGSRFASALIFAITRASCAWAVFGWSVHAKKMLVWTSSFCNKLGRLLFTSLRIFSRKNEQETIIKRGTFEASHITCYPPLIHRVSVCCARAPIRASIFLIPVFALLPCLFKIYTYI